MGFKKDAVTVPIPGAAPSKLDEAMQIVHAQIAKEMDGAHNDKNVAPQYSAEEKRVRGQVRMHAIIAGYKVASSLAPTLANTASGIKDELHKLAAEVAAKVEEYSFD